MLVVDRKPCTISLEDSLHMHGSMPFYVKDLSSRGFWYLRRVPKATPPWIPRDDCSSIFD